MAVVSDVTVRLRIDTSALNNSVGAVGKNLTSALLPVQIGLSQISSAMGKISKSMINFGKDSYMGFVEFERGMSKVSAMAGIVGSDLEAIEKKAMDLGATTEFTSSEVVSAFQAMALAGWEQADMLEGIDAALNLATISGLDFGNTTSYIINALAPFGKTAADAEKIVDLMAKTATSANFNINDLAKSFEYVAPIAGAMGYEIEDVNVALALLANNGLKGSKAGTALRRMLTDLNSKAEEGAIAIGDYSVAISDSEGKMRPLTAVMKDMSGAFANLTDSQKAQTAESLVGKTGMAGFLAIMEQGVDGITKMENKVKDYTGASQEMADTIRGDAMGSLDNLRSAFDNVKITIGKLLDKAFRPLIDALTSALRWFAELPDATKEVVIGVAGMILAFTVLTGVVVACIGVYMLFSAVLGTILAPVLAVIAGIVALGAVLVYLWKTNEEFRNKVVALWQSIKDFISAACEAIKYVWNTWGEELTAIAQYSWDKLTSIISLALDLIKGIINVVTALIKGDWDGVWNACNDIVSSIFETVVNVVTNALNIMLNVVSVVGEAIWNVVKNVFGWIGDAIMHPIETAKNFFKNSIEQMKGFLNFNWEFPKLKMPHFSISGSMNPLTWFENGVPKINVEWYAKGGIFSGPSVIGVGESGNEAVVPLNNKTKVRPFAQAITAEMGASGGAGGGIVINVGELAVREEADVRKVAQELYRLQQFKSRGRGSW